MSPINAIFKDLKVEGSGRVSVPLSASIVLSALVINGIVGQKFSPARNHPGTRRWYRRLEKPSFTPPGPVFGMVWTGIELGLAYGGYRLLRRKSSTARNVALAFWGANMAAIGGWSAIFFGKKALGASAFASAGMIASAVGYGVTAAKVDKPAAVTALPLIMWVAFATALAEEVWRRND